jgi:superfamily II DNA/RNA helicase
LLQVRVENGARMREPNGCTALRAEGTSLTDKTFAELGVAQPLLRALAAEDYHTPTPIQARAIPALLAGKDMLGIAQTGTGKTAAFALPLLQRLAANRHSAGPRRARVLVLAPTRELAIQIHDSFKTYASSRRSRPWRRASTRWWPRRAGCWI